MLSLLWRTLRTPTDSLPSTRLLLHHAVQPVAAVGESLLPRAPDDSQQSLALARGAPGRVLGAPVAGGSLRAGLDLPSFALLLCDGAGEPLARLPLAGRTLGEAVLFLSAELDRRGVRERVALPSHPADFPRHPVGGGAPFPEGDPAARRALALLLEDTAPVLRALSGSEPRLWPHHLDLATTVARGGLTFTLGVSPGDGPDGLPYWYATPWPSPPREALPPLEGGGRWRESGWSGAELSALRLASGAAEPAAQVLAFFRSALRMSGEETLAAHP